MPAPVIAERIGWPYSSAPLRKRLALIRPEYLGIDQVDRVSYEPGQVAQCDLWFPETKVQVGAGQERMLPVLVMTLGFSRYLSAVMIPSRQAGDILSGMWQLIHEIGRVPKTLVWDREAAIGGSGKPTAPAAAFAGTLATRIKLAPPRDPEYKGMVERSNGYLETSFLPGRQFASPADFNQQLEDWLVKVNSRTVRSIQGRPVDLLERDYLSMTPLPPVDPPTGLSSRIRLARDYYVRVDTGDYSVDPQVIGRFVDVTASLEEAVVFCDGQVVARHRRAPVAVPRPGPGASAWPWTRGAHPPPPRCHTRDAGPLAPCRPPQSPEPSVRYRPLPARRDCTTAAGIRLHTPAEAIDHPGTDEQTRNTDVTDVTDVTEIRTRRPGTGRKRQDKHTSGKNKQNPPRPHSSPTPAADTHSTAQPASRADTTHTRQSGPIKHLTNSPTIKILADTGHQERSAQTGDRLVTPPHRKSKKQPTGLARKHPRTLAQGPLLTPHPRRTRPRTPQEPASPRPPPRPARPPERHHPSHRCEPVEPSVRIVLCVPIWGCSAE